jgi:uncharacterized protein (TIGR02996 family)
LVESEPIDAKDSMNGSYDALYRAICANPDEDTPRLAFADLVEEEGDAARAAFIRAQVALARVPEYDALHIAARRSDPGALNGHLMTDTLPMVPAGFGWHAFEFRRGLPWKVGVSTAAAFDADGAIFDVAPIQALTISPHNRFDIEVPADWPHLARIQRLEFTGARFSGDDAERLSESPHLAKLTEFTFDFDGITADGLEVFARSSIFPRLTFLDLRANSVPPALLVDALGGARDRGALAWLSLAANRLDGIDADQLFSLPVMSDLAHLDLSDNPRLGVGGAVALAERGILRGLRALNLERTHPGVPGVKALCETGALASLSSLNLAANRLGPTAVKFLAESQATRGLRILNLSGNPVGDSGTTSLTNSPALMGLLELNLADARVSDRGALALAESPYLANLLHLDLSGRPFGKLAREALHERFGSRVKMA